MKGLTFKINEFSIFEKNASFPIFVSIKVMWNSLFKIELCCLISRLLLFNLYLNVDFHFGGRDNIQSIYFFFERQTQIIR